MGKKDPAWKWAEKTTGSNNNVNCKCTFCGLVITSGINRLKHHLAGNHKGVRPCNRVPADVKQEAKALLGEVVNSKQESERLMAERVDLSSHSAGLHTGLGSSHDSVSTRDIRGPMDDYVIGISPDGSATVSVSERAKVVRQNIARYFYENSIPFHTASSPSFIGMVKSIGEFGRGLSVPSAYELSTPLLKEEVRHTDLTVEVVKRSWDKTGVTIVSDGWKDGRGRQLINFLVNNPKGTVFLRTIDASSSIKTADMLFRLLDDVVEEVGESKVIQVITDNAANYVAAGKLLMQKRQHLYWTPCAAHCIDLMLEKIGELPQHKRALGKAKKVTKFIYNHGYVHSMMKVHCPKELVRPAATRFGTCYMTLKSMLEMKQPLQAMFTSPDWTTSTYAQTSEGKKVRTIVLDDDVFWPSVDYSIKTTEPLFYVLRMVDAERVPAMGFLYGAMENAKKDIKESFKDDLGAYNEIIKTIDAKWDKQLHRPIHAIACFLNPHYQYDESWIFDMRVRSGIFEALKRLVPNEDEALLIDSQMDIFKNKNGVFGEKMAMLTAKTKSPCDWWDSYGYETPELRDFAYRVLGLTCSSSACERNWSTFNQIHTKRRNRLTVEKMNDLAYISYNKKLRERHLLKSSTKVTDEEILTHETYPSDDEWVACSDDEVDTQRESMRAPTQLTQIESQGVVAQDTQPQIASGSGSKRTYSRKRKTTPGTALAQEKSRERMRRIDEESEEFNSDAQDDESAIPYADTSQSDDSSDGGESDKGDGNDEAPLNPTVQLPDSNDTMFQFSP